VPEFFAKRKNPYDHSMSTRRLIIAAVLCGLAILGAGTAFLVRTSTNKDRLTVPDVFQVGQVGRSGGAEVRVVSVDVGTAVTTLVVDVTVLDVTGLRPITDLAAPFALAAGSTITKPNATAGAASVPTCRGFPAVPDQKQTCALAFDVHPSGSFFVSFTTPAGGQVQWRLSA
jgi:hypothetical protein